jgi:hypothetical protein
MLQTVEESGPFGMKGMGEVGINGPLPAIANAVAQACGINVTQAPLTAERILSRIRSLNYTEFQASKTRVEEKVALQEGRRSK